MTVKQIEIAVAEYIGIRRNMIVPNVYWGMGLSFECDLFYVTGSGYAHEVEIKISKADLVRDKKKPRHKWDKYVGSGAQTIVRSRTFVIPAEMKSCASEIPEQCGVILVKPGEDRNGNTYIRCQVLRKAKTESRARKLTDKEIMHLGRLAAMRIWSMKKAMSAQEGKEKP